MSIRARMVSFGALLTIMALGIVAFAPKAYALPTSALSTIFLDANSNVIGQRILDCHGQFQHAGYDSSSTTVYQVVIEYNCSSFNWICRPTQGENGNQPECNFTSTPYAANVASVNTAQGFTVSDFCSLQKRQAGYFYGAPDCSYQPNPPKATNLTGWTPGA